MAKKYAQLVRIDQDREIRKDTDYEAWYHLEQGLLLALKESGTLNAAQYRLAEQKLKQQRAERARKLMEGNV